MKHAQQIAKWMKEDGFAAPQLGCKWNEALALIHAYIQYLRERGQND